MNRSANTMLSATDKTDIHNLLSRFNTIPDGETVVANILRSLEAGIVLKPLAKIILKAWCDKVRDADSINLSTGLAPLSGEAALKLTESEFLSTAIGAPTPSPLWDTIRNRPYDPFRGATTDTVSNVKKLSTVMQYMLGVSDLNDPHSPGTPIALSHHTSRAQRRRQKNRIERALQSTSVLKPGARIHHRRWFWVTTQNGLKTALTGLIDDKAAAAKAVDVLGLVHFSRELATQTVADKYVVEVQLNAGYAPEFAKPSFIFADHNPRFVAWTDSSARANKKWGQATNLEKYHMHVQLEQGEQEMIKATPDQIVIGDVARFCVLGYLDVNRWGAGEIAEGTEVFADRLRFSRSKAEVVDTILMFLG